MQPAVAKNEKVGVITSSPGPTPAAIIATSRASVPDDTPIGVRHLEVAGELTLERQHLLAHDAALAVAHARDGGEDRLAEGSILRLEVEEGDGFDHGLAGHPAR